MRPLEHRSRYESDSAIPWPLLPILIGGALLAAVAVAWLLKFAYVNNCYLIFLLPGLAAIALGGFMFALVYWTRCRNCWLAGAVGSVAGIVAYLGYYQFCLIDLLQPGNTWRVAPARGVGTDDAEREESCVPTQSVGTRTNLRPSKIRGVPPQARG